MSRFHHRVALAALIFLPAMALVLIVFLPKMGRWLEISSPLHRVDLVVALGGDRARQELAADLFRRGLADHVLFTGADARERDYSCLDIPREKALPLPAPSYTTGEEAKAVRDIAETSRFRSLIIVTAPFHSRRALAIFRHAMRGTGAEVMVSVTKNPPYATGAWWKSHMGVKTVLSEYAGFVYYWLHGEV